MAVQFKDYYETLGVSRDADAGAIRKAYRDLARKYHPDVSKEPDAAARFSEINEAYEVLKDDEKRKRYDQFGHGFQGGQEFRPPPGFEGFSFGGPGGSGGGSGFSDFFEMLFGAAGGREGGAGFQDMFGGGRGHQARPRKGGDAEAEIELSLEQLLAGGKTEFSLRDAQGKTRTLSVGIPPGTTQGTRIRLGGQGSPGAGGGPAGDLLLRIRVAEHPRFALEGTDLRETLDVTPWEAALGAKVEVKTLDGAVDLKIPPGTPSERVFRLRGLGLRRTADQRGDLLVKLRIVVPPEPTDDERRLFEELAEKSSFRPRGS